MAAPDSNVISDDTHDYQLLEPIGTWGPDIRAAIYEAFIIPQTSYSDHFAVMAKSDAGQGFFKIAVDEARENRSFNFYPANNYILTINKFFRDKNNDSINLCIVLPFDTHVSSLRSLMSSNPRLNADGGGLPENCIAIPLGHALNALSHIHKLGRYHRQITAGNIFACRQECAIKLAYSASIYERTAPAAAAATINQGGPSSNQETESFLEIKFMLDWARAPEVEKDETSRYRYKNITEKSDIWLIGIAALELAYGKIQVVNRDELIVIAGYISKNHKLPNTWETLRTKSAAEKNRGRKRINIDKFKNFVSRKVSIKKKERRFSESFVDMVAHCLAEDDDRRPTSDELLKHDFIHNPKKSIDYFYDFVVNFQTPRSVNENFWPM